MASMEEEFGGLLGAPMEEKKRPAAITPTTKEDAEMQLRLRREYEERYAKTHEGPTFKGPHAHRQAQELALLEQMAEMNGKSLTVAHLLQQARDGDQRRQQQAAPAAAAMSDVSAYSDKMGGITREEFNARMDSSDNPVTGFTCPCCKKALLYKQATQNLSCATCKADRFCTDGCLRYHGMSH